MSDIQNVQLGFSCPLKREDMEVTEQGHFCSSCSKEVIDFTDKSQADFDKIIKASPQRICGAFKTSQLSQAFLKYAAATAIAGSTLLGACREIDIIPSDPIAIEEETFELGLFITGELLLPDEEVLGLPITYPEPVGGIEQFYLALYKELKPPKGMEASGKVYLRLRIDETGKVTKVEVIKELAPSANKEAIRAVKAIDFLFKPATFKEGPGPSDFIVPVNFQY